MLEDTRRALIDEPSNRPEYEVREIACHLHQGRAVVVLAHKGNELRVCHGIKVGGLVGERNNQVKVVSNGTHRLQLEQGESLRGRSNGLVCGKKVVRWGSERSGKKKRLFVFLHTGLLTASHKSIKLR